MCVCIYIYIYIYIYTQTLAAKKQRRVNGIDFCSLQFAAAMNVESSMSHLPPTFLDIQHHIQAESWGGENKIYQLGLGLSKNNMDQFFPSP